MENFAVPCGEFIRDTVKLYEPLTPMFVRIVQKLRLTGFIFVYSVYKHTLGTIETIKLAATPYCLLSWLGIATSNRTQASYQQVLAVVVDVVQANHRNLQQNMYTHFSTFYRRLTYR